MRRHALYVSFGEHNLKLCRRDGEFNFKTLIMYQLEHSMLYTNELWSKRVIGYSCWSDKILVSQQIIKLRTMAQLLRNLN